VTFTDAVTFHLNGEEIRAFHVAPAHTDGDAVVVFTQANVIHMGDLFFHGRYPFVDLDSGGSVPGIVAAADRILALADERTRIIPGHGPLAGRAELKAYRDVVAAAHDKVAALVKAGKSREEVIAAKPTAEWDAAWGTGFVKPDAFAGTLFDSLKAGR
jgi:glyoxylase-like metal-dependent hydrolase (beta-lactamase superfamily II)